jgi:restriction system protein
MAVPDFQSLMIPVLNACADGSTVRASEVSKRVATALSLTEADLAELLPSGKAKLFYNRTGWARSYLLKAALLSQPKHAFYQITERGHQALAEGLDRIDVKYLKQFPEFQAFVAPSKPFGEGDGTVDPIDLEQNPLEMIENGYASMRAELAADLISQIKACSPEFFQQLVVDLLVAMGYGGSRADAGHAVGGSGDGGIDGIIKEDRLGLDAVYIQAKRWEGSVGGPVVQAFAGSLVGQKASKGVMITTSHYTKDAQAYVEKIEKKIVLIDGPRLAELMIDFGIGVTEVASYSIKRLDSDYFEADAVQ